MSIIAENTEQSVKIKPQYYKLEKKFEFCYYEISAKDYDMQSKSNLTHIVDYKLSFKLIKSDEVNVYIYGGKYRDSAKNSIVKGNEQVVAGTEYTIDAEKGLFVVMFPNEMKSYKTPKKGDFEFSYQLKKIE